MRRSTLLLVACLAASSAAPAQPYYGTIQPITAIPDNSYFGSSMTTVGFSSNPDLNLVVGAPLRNSVYIYERDLSQTMIPIEGLGPSSSPTASFGAALAALRDAPDNMERVLVGAPGATVGGHASAGLVNTYRLNDGFGPTLLPPTPTSSGYFGAWVATVPSQNADAIDDILVTEPNFDGSGRTHLFSGANFSLISTLTAPDPVTGDGYGMRGKIGDLNGDGREDLLFMTYRDGASAEPERGRVYIRSGADLSVLLTFPDPGSDPAEIVYTAGTVPDQNGDSQKDVAVAVGSSPPGGSAVSRIYLMNGATGAELSTISFPPDNPGAGVKIATYEDMNGDAIPEVLVASPYAKLGTVDFEAGAILVFSGADFSYLQKISSNTGANKQKGFFHILPDLVGGPRRELAMAGAVEPFVYVYTLDGYAHFTFPQQSFPNTIAGSVSPTLRSNTITNRGMASLTINSMEFNNSNFSIATNPAPVTLAPYGTATVVARYSPQTEDAHFAQLRAYCDVPGGPGLPYFSAVYQGIGLEQHPKPNTGIVYVGVGTKITMVELATGNRRAISASFTTDAVGSGQFIEVVGGLLVESTDDLLCYESNGFILRVDRSTGDRTTLPAPFSSPSVPSLGGGSKLQLLDSNTALAGTRSTVMRLDLATGTRTAVSSSTVGSGPALSNVTDYLLVGDTVYTASPSAPQMLRINTTTGERTAVVNDAGGLQFRKMVLLDSGSVAVATGTGVSRVNLATGAITPISDSVTGAGPAFLPIAGIARDGGMLYVYSHGQQTLFRVNPNTGDREVVSKFSTSPTSRVGTGPTFGSTSVTEASLAFPSEYLPAMQAPRWMQYR